MSYYQYLPMKWSDVREVDSKMMMFGNVLSGYPKNHPETMRRIYDINVKPKEQLSKVMNVVLNGNRKETLPRDYMGLWKQYESDCKRCGATFDENLFNQEFSSLTRAEVKWQCLTPTFDQSAKTTRKLKDVPIYLKFRNEDDKMNFNRDISEHRMTQLVKDVMVGDFREDLWRKVKSVWWDKSFKLYDLYCDSDSDMLRTVEYMDAVGEVFDFFKEGTNRFNQLTYQDIVRKMSRQERKNLNIYMNVANDVIVNLTKNKFGPYECSFDIKASRRLKFQLINKMKQIGYLNPAIAEGIIKDISCRIFEENVKGKKIYRAYIIIDNEYAISLWHLLRFDCYQIEFVKMLAHTLIANPVRMTDRLQRLAKMQQPMDRLEGFENATQMIDVLREQIKNKLSPHFKALKYMAWAQISLSIYNIITNIVSIWRGDKVLRIMNVIGLLLNIISFITTLCSIYACDLNNVMDTTITSLYYKWFTFALQTNPEINDILDDEVKEKIKEANKQIEAEEEKQVPLWQKFKTLLKGEDNTEKKKVLDLFKDHSIATEMSDIIMVDEYEKYFPKLEILFKSIDVELIKIMSRPKLMKECIHVGECRCLWKALVDSENFEFVKDTINKDLIIGMTITNRDKSVTPVTFRYESTIPIEMEVLGVYMQELAQLPHTLRIEVFQKMMKTEVLESISTSKWVSMGFNGVLTIAALGICFYATKHQVDEKGKPLPLNNNFAQSIIQFATLKNALKGVYSDVEQFSNAIVESCDNTISTAMEMRIAKCLALNELLNRFLSLNDITFMRNTALLKKFETALTYTKSFLTEKFEQERNEEMSRGVAILMGTLRESEQRIKDIQKTVTAAMPKQACLLVWLVGENSAGKSYLVKNKINDYFKEKFGYQEIFPISFGSQPEYFPDMYAEQEMGIYDEFNQCAEDPMMAHINVLDSEVAVNLPGASIPTKVRPCKFEVIFFTSNTGNLKSVSRLNKWSIEALKAMNSRMLKFKIKNILDKRQNPEIEREKVEHCTDYSHLDICRLYEDIEGKKLKDDVPYRLEEMLTEIEEEIRRRKRVYEGILERTGQEVQKVNIDEYDVNKVVLNVKVLSEQEKKERLESKSRVFTVLISGPTGTGKTDTSKAVSAKLAATLKMPIVTFDVHDVKDSSKAKALVNPSIICTDDAMGDELAYMAFWDNIPAGSIVINTSNLNVRQMSRFAPWRFKQAWKFSSNYYTLLNKLAINATKQFLQVENEYPVEGVKPVAGFVRRTGLTGYVVHGDQLVYVPKECGLWYTKDDGYVSFNEAGEPLSDISVYQEIFAGYVKFMKECANILTLRVETPTSLFRTVRDVPDVIIKTTTPRQLQKILNDPYQLYVRQCASEKWVNSLKTPFHVESMFDDMPIPFVYTSKRVIENFSSTVQAFRIPENDEVTDEEVCEFGRRTYQVLRNSSPEFDVLVDCGTVRVTGNGGIIKWATNGIDLVNRQPYAWKKEADTYIIFNDMRSIKFTKEQIADININGFRSHVFSTELVYEEQVEILNTIKQIYAEKEFKVIKERIELQEISRKIIKESKGEVLSTWQLFKKSKWYTIFKIVGLLLTIGIAIITLWAAFSSFFPRSVNKEIVNVNGSFYEVCSEPTEVTITADKKNTKSDLEVQNEIQQSCPAYLQAYDIEKKDFVSKKVIVKREELQYFDEGRNKSIPDKKVITLKSDSLNTAYSVGPAKTIFRVQGLDSLTNKVNKNIVAVVRGDGKSSAYGLGIKGNLVICNAHVIYGFVDNIVERDGGRQFAARTVFCDYQNDIAIMQVLDRRCERFTDITKYFVTMEHVEKTHPSVMLRPTLINNTYVLNLVNGTSTYNPQYVVRADYEENIVTNVYQTIFYDHKTNKSMVGQCGLPYISTRSDTNLRNILGIHMSSSGFNANSTTVTQEYLELALESSKDHIILDEALQSLDSDNENYIDIVAEIKAEGNLEKIDNFVVNKEMYENVIEKVQDKTVFPELFEDSDWLTDAGYIHAGAKTDTRPKHAYEKAPWAAELTTKIDADNSCLTPEDPRITEPEGLIKDYKGKPSILGTQLNYHNEPKPLTPVMKTRLGFAVKKVVDNYKAIYGDEIPMLTHQEAINSVYDTEDENYNCIPNLEEKASTGYYVATFKKAPLKSDIFKNVAKDGSRKRMQYKDTPAGQYVKDEVEAFLRFAKEGKCLLDIGKASLKAEILASEKIRKGLTRLFSPRGVVSFVVERMVFGCFMGKIKRNRDKGTCQVGIDKTLHFTQLYHRFKKTGNMAICLDFKRWDKHILPDLVKAAFKVIYGVMEKKGDSDEIKQYNKELWNIIMAICQTFISELIYADGQLMFRTVGMPSGTVLTSVINSIINDIITATYQLTMSVLHPNFVKEFNRIDEVNYGDDKVIIIPPEIQHVFTAEHFSKFVEENFGIESTMPDKSVKEKHLIPLDQIEFLSHKMIPAPEAPHLVIPQLKHSSIAKQLYFWKNLDPREVKDSLEKVLEDACAHSKPVYSQVLKDCVTIVKFMKQHHLGEITPIFQSYENCRRTVLQKIDPSYGTENLRDKSDESFIALFKELKNIQGESIKLKPTAVLLKTKLSKVPVKSKEKRD